MQRKSRKCSYAVVGACCQGTTGVITLFNISKYATYNRKVALGINCTIKLSNLNISHVLDGMNHRLVYKVDTIDQG